MPLSITRLKLHHFRNYPMLDIMVKAGKHIVLTGKNGAGKTNILEAVSLLTSGKGLRGAKLSQLDCATTHTPWAIYAELETPQGSLTLGTARDVTLPSKEKRIVKINNTVQRSQHELAEHITIAALTPAMDQTFADGATSRRHFLDKLVAVFHPDSARHHAVYNHAKSERLRLLNSRYGDASWLTALEKRMAEHGVTIAAARLETLGQLQHSMDASASFPHAVLALEGATESRLQTMRALEAEAALMQELAENRNHDATSGITHAGIHRSDFRVTHSHKNMPAEFCSTGEQKALLLSLILATARARRTWKGTAPIVLLDEVVAHLDPTKRAELAEQLADIGTQCWLTGTDAAFFADFQSHAQFITVKEGCVIQEEMA